MSINNTEKQKLIGTYKPKILGIRNYKHSKKEFFMEDFLNLKSLDGFLEEVGTGECDITPAGKAFLEKYYGLGELANLLANEIPTEDNRAKYKEDITRVLKYLEPMQTMSFVEQARGNISKDFTFREDLLPPKE